MSRGPRLPVAVVEPPNSMIASANRMSGVMPRPMARPSYASDSWQSRGWDFFDTTGELRYAAGWVSNVLSRAVLYAATRVDRQYVAQDPGTPASFYLDQLFYGPEGQAEMLGAFGVHLFVAGECYLVGRKPVSDRDYGGVPADQVDGDIWEVVSTEEMTTVGNKWAINYGNGQMPLVLGEDDVVIRIWTPHPRKRVEADSPVRAVLHILEEMRLLDQHIVAQIISRLTGAGILFLPQGMTFPTPEGVDLPPNATEADKAMAVLYEAITTAVRNPGDASAVTPIIMTVPDEFVDKAHLMTFWSELDKQVVEMRTSAMHRLALGLDVPVEILEGTSDMNHWGAWQMEESSIKAHIEPMLEKICASLTVGFLRPATGNREDTIRYETVELRLRPNRSKEALELYDRGEMNGTGLRRETGFTEGDAPDDEQFRLWMLRKVAGGSATPEQVGAALTALGIDLGELGLDNTTPRDEQPPPSLRDHPTRDIPEEPEASLLPMAEALVFRALERAGNRLRATRRDKPAGIGAADVYLFIGAKPDEVDTLLSDAWTCIPRVMRGTPFEQQQVIGHALDSYVRMLLTNQQEHDPTVMARYLTREPIRTLDPP